ncbi:MAG: helix-turn-helix transcriptional regulator [Sulfuricurvum sp.]|uniref:helix-turn-helix domain-containing protein n=1 Tax=Sulfuricurvum sp. TaxID=2025608 RepID=UPI002609C0A0|nr:helix-turn-helix transcriptional regulator [Sulfuricurvum sp.]MDD2829443.1 helix-turn-helix transcriptional regulator [Sulfuricurvum sp.]MDD4948474.1 helix-turn-helix transcriptional regulator [Sulfuricurvum sp.]
MREEEAPQDNISIYRGGKKALYAAKANGEYAVTPSSGWAIEEMATLQAVEEFNRLEREAYQGFLEKRISPLGVWMNRRRMSLKTLSECSGFWQWSIKRHLQYDTFKKLNPKTIALYCDVLDVSEEELNHPKESI